MALADPLALLAVALALAPPAAALETAAEADADADLDAEAEAEAEALADELALPAAALVPLRAGRTPAGWSAPQVALGAVGQVELEQIDCN